MFRNFMSVCSQLVLIVVERNQLSYNHINDTDDWESAVFRDWRGIDNVRWRVTISANVAASLRVGRITSIMSY